MKLRYKNRDVRSAFVTAGVVRSAFVTIGDVRSAFVTTGDVRSATSPATMMTVVTKTYENIRTFYILVA